VQLVLKRQPKTTGSSTKSLVAQKRKQGQARTRRLCVLFFILWVITISLIGGLLNQGLRAVYGVFGGLGFLLSIGFVVSGINDMIMYLPRRSGVHCTSAKVSHYTWYEGYNGETAARQIESFNLSFTAFLGFYQYPICYSHQVQTNPQSKRIFNENQEIFVYYTMKEEEGKLITQFRMKFQFHDIRFYIFLFLGAFYLSTCLLVLSCAPYSWNFLQTQSLLVSSFVFIILIFVLGFYVQQNPGFHFEIYPTKRVLDLDLFNKEVTTGLIDILPEAIISLVILPFFDKDLIV